MDVASPRTLDWRPSVATTAAAVGYVLGTYVDVVGPVELALRPLVVAGIVGLVVGLLAARAGRWAVPIAVIGLTLILDPRSGIFLVLVLGAAWILSRLRHRTLDLNGPLLVMTLAFAGVGVVRMIPNLPAPDVTTARDDRPVYLVLLDGYPRLDSLAAHGIDNSSFIEALSARGFDHYPDAHTLHRWTDRTLTAMLSGPEGVPDVASLDRDLVDVHRALRVPDGFAAVAPPVGHVVLRGPTLPVDSVTDFEAHLIGRSLAPYLARDQLRAWIAHTLEGRIDASLDHLATTPGPLFVHLMAPHPPFIGGPECWPDCHFFQNFAVRQGISAEEWWERLGTSLPSLNAALLDAVDAVIERDAAATIVLFSDHGGRATEDEMDEWFRTLLVARTPGHPELFASDPRPDAILRLIGDAPTD